VEFLLDQSGQFYFLEVNTRLQVEHPITEVTTGVDLVAQQLKIAAGFPLAFTQQDLQQRGHAIECRIYAEDPEADFCPSPGRILYHQEPSGPGIRNDCGVYSGFEVPVQYDPILSKLIVNAETREAARSRMIRTLESYAILGIQTTIPFLIDILRTPAFAEGRTHIDFLDHHFANWVQDMHEADLARIAYVIDELNASKRVQTKTKDAGQLSPWHTLGDWSI
jgi:acetyl/propionyl-CoA carboxylase alpha subunit